MMKHKTLLFVSALTVLSLWGGTAQAQLFEECPFEEGDARVDTLDASRYLPLEASNLWVYEDERDLSYFSIHVVRDTVIAGETYFEVQYAVDLAYAGEDSLAVVRASSSIVRIVDGLVVGAEGDGHGLFEGLDLGMDFGTCAEQEGMGGSTFYMTADGSGDGHKGFFGFLGYAPGLQLVFEAEVGLVEVDWVESPHTGKLVYARVGGEDVVGTPIALLATSLDDAGLARPFAADAFPNPFARQATLRFTLPDAARARLVVYDALGREVVRLVDADLRPGTHTATLDGAALPSGAYLYRLMAGAHIATGTLLLAR